MPNVLATSALALALPTAVFLGGAQLMSRLSGRQEPTNAEKPLMQRWRGYSTSEVGDHWARLGETKLKAELRFLQLDLAFPLLYGAALLTSLLLVWASLGRPFPASILVGSVAVTILADWAENLIHLRQLSRFLEQGREALQVGWIAIASGATIAKLLAFGASTLGLVALVVVLVLRGSQ